LGEHWKEEDESSAVSSHMSEHSHNFTRENISILVGEAHKWKRKIREGISIHQQQPELNTDPGLQSYLIYRHLLSHDQPRSCAVYNDSHNADEGLAIRWKCPMIGLFSASE